VGFSATRRPRREDDRDATEPADTLPAEPREQEVTMSRRIIVALAAVAIGGLTAVGMVNAGDGKLSPELQAVRAAVAKYHDYNQAVADGYSLAGEPCVSSPAGAMGIHAPNPALIGNPALDPLRPEILLYAPTANGGYKLVGVEYMKIDADQDLNTADDRPSLFGRAFEGPMLGHNPTMPIHYDMHVWVAEQNPSGVFAQFNPDVSCR
jgi:hypothetical protein